MDDNKYNTTSTEETQEIGRKIGSALVGGEVLAFYGDLGAGKTTLIQGIADSLGIKKRVISPTFIIVRKYETNYKTIKWFYHIDLYRLEEKNIQSELENLGLYEIMGDKDCVVAIEWAEKMQNIFPIIVKKIEINMEDNKREIKII